MNNKQNIILLGAAGILLTAAAVSFYLNNAEEAKDSKVPIQKVPNNFLSGDNTQSAVDNKSMPPNHEMLMNVKSLRDQLQKNPNDLEHWIQLGNLLYDNGDFQGAIEPYEKALNLNPANTNVRNDYAVCFFNTGNSGRAIQELEKVSLADPDNISALFNLGVVHANRGQKGEAKKYWSMVVQKQPNSDMGQKAAKALTEMN
jgi:cytochrome c-type biogenesis protein CcmH/NrfG